MKQLLLILTIFIIFIAKANQPINEEPTSITVHINNKTYDISIDLERPYIVWYSDTEYYESYNLDELIEFLYTIK